MKVVSEVKSKAYENFYNKVERKREDGYNLGLWIWEKERLET